MQRSTMRMRMEKSNTYNTIKYLEILILNYRCKHITILQQESYHIFKNSCNFKNILSLHM